MSYSSAIICGLELIQGKKIQYYSSSEDNVVRYIKLMEKIFKRPFTYTRSVNNIDGRLENSYVLEIHFSWNL